MWQASSSAGGPHDPNIYQQLPTSSNASNPLPAYIPQRKRPSLLHCTIYASILAALVLFASLRTCFGAAAAHNVKTAAVEQLGRVKDVAIDYYGGVAAITDGMEEEEEIYEFPPCDRASRRRVADPTSWKVERFDTHSFVVLPRLSNLTGNPCTSHAVFSTRLLSLGPPQIIFALPAPTTTPQGYLIPIDFSIPLPKGKYQIEVVLEFGFLYGAKRGMVCGSEEGVCSDLKDIGLGVGFVGKTVKWYGSIGEDIIEWSDFEDGEAASVCTSLPTLSGYWSAPELVPSSSNERHDYSHDFVPMSPSHYRCRLLQPLAPGIPSHSRDPIWLHIIGDSNSRHLFETLSETLGEGETIKRSGRDSPLKVGVIAGFSPRSSSGTFTSDLDWNFVFVTWHWWQQEPEVTLERLEANAAQLTELTNHTLLSFISQTKLRIPASVAGSGMKEKMETLRPTRTYISLGSHAEALTSLGAQNSLNTILDSRFLSDSILRDDNVHFFTTTFVNPSNIPQDLFPMQDLVRNNAVIEARNDVLRRRKELQGRVIDIQGLTKGITREWMRDTLSKKKRDPVHFRPWVYKAWVQVVWTELFGTD